LVLGPFDLTGHELTEAPEIGQPLTLDAARQLPARIPRDRVLGHDVIGLHKAAKRKRRATALNPAGNSFPELACRYITERAKPSLRGWRETARNLGLDPDNDLETIPSGLCEMWADKDVRTIDKDAIADVIDAARADGIPGKGSKRAGPSEARARHFHNDLSALFAWLVKRRKIDANPLQSLQRPEPSQDRDRHLTSEEIVKLWKAVDQIPKPFAAAVKLLLLTGQRRSEISELRWNEMPGDLSQINLAATRTKNKLPHVVPLSSLAQDIIASIPRIECPFVFTTDGKAPIGGWSKVKKQLDVEMRIPPWRLHDLRRTAVTGMAELGIRPDVIELVVNHVSGRRGGIAGVYNRSELMAERKNALERWSAHVEGLATGQANNVVDLRARHGGLA
jgi:integrase